MPRPTLTTTTTRALFASFSSTTTATTATTAANPALSLYRAALRAIARLPDSGARDYYRAYARQNLNEYRDERDPQRVAQLLEHGRSAAEFLIKKHLGGGGGGGVGGDKAGGGSSGRSR